MRIWSIAFLAALSVGMAAALTEGGSQAQTRIVLKAGESVELKNVYYISNCRSIMIGLPEIEILEGPQQVTLSIKQGMVLPRRQNCAKKVPGGTLMATAKDVLEPLETKMTYRLKYKTKDGDRQNGAVVLFSLFP